MNSAPEEGYVRNDLAVRPRRVLRRTSHSRMGALLIEVNDVGLSKECSLLSLNQVCIILPPEILLMLQILAVQAWQRMPMLQSPHRDGHGVCKDPVRHLGWAM